MTSCLVPAWRAASTRRRLIRIFRKAGRRAFPGRRDSSSMELCSPAPSPRTRSRELLMRSWRGKATTRLRAYASPALNAPGVRLTTSFSSPVSVADTVLLCVKQPLASSALQNCPSNRQVYVPPLTEIVVGSAPAPVDPDSDPSPGLPLATPQVVPRTPPWTVVMDPNAMSLNADRFRISSVPVALVFFTSTLYLTVAQPAVLPTKVLVIVPVVAASCDVTVTWLEALGPNVPFEAPWPETCTMLFTVRSSAWVAVKVHDWSVFCAIVSAVQVVPVLLPTVPVAQEGPVNPVTWKMVPYALSQIWSTTTVPKFEVLVMSTV